MEEEGEGWSHCVKERGDGWSHHVEARGVVPPCGGGGERGGPTVWRKSE